MASATATTNLERPIRGLFASRIARTIFLANLVGLVALTVGALLLSETRNTLTQAQISALQVQGGVIANLLIDDAVIDLQTPGQPPFIDRAAAGQTLLNLAPQTAALKGDPYLGPRITIIDAQGVEVADTATLHGDINEQPLSPSEQRARTPVGSFLTWIGKMGGRLETWRLTPWRPNITLEQERAQALAGEMAAGQRLTSQGQRVISVTMPLQRVGYVVGAVTLESADVERILAAERLALIPYVVGAAIGIFLASLVLALMIAQPLRRLAGEADKVRVGSAERLFVPDVRHRKDEIGELAMALEGMTGALADRIDANEQFAADVSHEIKNPLTSIRSAVETVRQTNDDTTRQRLLGVIAQDVGRLDRLITDMTRASRIEAETARGALERVDLAKLLSDIAASYALLTDGRAKVSYEGDIVEAAVIGQPGPIGQVVLNLIDNARSFAPADGHVRLNVGLLPVRDGAIVRLVVEDDGPGIPEANLEAIFRRFYTDRPKGAAFGGNSGLGLSIARQIVEALNGRIYAENVHLPGATASQGARLIVELPAAPANK
jgi:two-component system, OmpR family, sensor histidine kinase ChvG